MHRPFLIGENEKNLENEVAPLGACLSHSSKLILSVNYEHCMNKNQRNCQIVSRHLLLIRLQKNDNITMYG